VKYVLFMIALSGVVPAAFLAAYNRKLMRLIAFMMLATVLVFNQTAINFMSHETYRGTSRGMEISAIHLCAFSLLLAILIRKGRLKLVPDAGIWVFLVYFLLSLLSIVNSANVLFSFFEVWKMVMLYVVFIAAWNYMDLTGDVEVFLYGMAAVVFLNFGVVVWGYFRQVYQASGVFPHQNSMGMYMALAGNLFLACFFSAKDHFRRGFFAIAFVVASVSLVRTFSRGAIACYPIGCGLTMIASLMYEFDRRKVMLIAGVGCAALVGSLLFVNRVIERFETAPERSASTRVELAASALKMMNDKVLGVGLNNWGIKINPPYPYARERNDKSEFNDEAKDGIVETVYLLVGAECGYGGLLALLVWFGYYWTLALRMLKKMKYTPWFFIVAGAFGGLPANYLQSVLEWVLKQQINFIQLVVIFAMLSFVSYQYKKERAQLRSQGGGAPPLRG